MKKKNNKMNLARLAFVFIGLVLFSCEDEQIFNTIDNKNSLIKKETYFNLKDSSIFRTTEYFYNSERQLVSKNEKYYIDTLANIKSKYFYNEFGNLILIIAEQTGWTDDLMAITEERKTKYAYSDDILESEITFVDSAGRGFEQKKYYYTNLQLDSIEHSSFSVRQNLKQSHTEYFKYEDNVLVEKGYDRINDRGRNTVYEYFNGLLIKEYNNYWLTSYEYEGVALKKQITESGNMPFEKIEYKYSENVLKEKLISRFSVYSENPSKPYSTEIILFEY